MVTTEHSQTQTHENAKTEQATGRERLTHQQLREAAAIAFLAVLIAAYQNRESDHLFIAPGTSETGQEPAANRAEIFSLINNAFAKDTEQAADTGGYHEYQPKDVFITSISGYRDSIFTPQHPKAAAPEPEFKPAPSLSDVELGPQLPNLAFNDRIRPVSKGATDADFAAADRANELYKHELVKTGWQGGEVTEAEDKKASRGVMRAAHPDTGSSPLDQEAAKMFNANRAKPVTKTGSDAGAAPSPE